MERLESIYHRITKSVTLLSSIALVIMMLITVVNILSRAVFNFSINGTYEIARFMCLTIVVFAIPNAELESAMVSVTFLEEWTSPRFSNRIKILCDFLGTAFFGFVGVYYINQAISKAAANSVSTTLLLPLWIPMIALSACFLLLAAAMAIKGCLCFAARRTLPNKRPPQGDEKEGASK